MKDSTSQKEKLRLYLILFLIGILSLPLGLFSIAPLSGIVAGFQNNMEIYTDSSIPTRLKKAFENNGISLSEDNRIFKLSENMVRTHGEKAYEIRNEDGKINVYHNRGDYGTAFKFGENYYMIEFTHGD